MAKSKKEIIEEIQSHITKRGGGIGGCMLGSRQSRRNGFLTITRWTKRRTRGSTARHQVTVSRGTSRSTFWIRVPKAEPVVATKIRSLCTRIGSARALGSDKLRQSRTGSGRRFVSALRTPVMKPAAKTVRPVSVVIRPLWSVPQPQCRRDSGEIAFSRARTSRGVSAADGGGSSTRASPPDQVSQFGLPDGERRGAGREST